MRKRAASGRGAPNLADGVNGAIMRTLADGEPHRYSDLKKAVAAAGYRSSGIGSRLGRLRELGVAVQAGPGLWRKT